MSQVFPVAQNPLLKDPAPFKPVSAAEQNAANITNRWTAAAADEQAVSSANAKLGMGSNYATKDASDVEGGAGSLAKINVPKPGGELQDIVKQFPWTISNAYLKKDIPYIQLLEHKVEGGQIQKQLSFYAYGVYGATEDIVAKASGNGNADEDILSVYKEIFPKNPTGFKYKFPYFAKAYYELSTPQWQQFDKIGQAGSAMAGGLSKIAKSLGGKLGAALDLGVDIAQGTAAAATSVAEAGLMATYPVIGIADRPRIFTSHNERTVKIEFPLYNTINSWHWTKNKDFIHLFASQNLFNKRNFITGLPPVWYEVYVPGSYYSVASCVTQFDVQNLGNTRLMSYGGQEFIVPDAYQVSISLTEMALPSRNQFEASFSGLGSQRVTSSEAEPTPAFQEQTSQPAPLPQRGDAEKALLGGKPRATGGISPNGRGAAAERMRQSRGG